MKKYLMTIAAAAICAAFTSCSHDFETPSQEEIDQLKAKEAFAKYENAFIAAFGQPAATQDWGFGSSASARTLTRSVDYTLAPVTPAYGMPAYPSFTSKTTVSQLEPTLTGEYYTTKSAVTASNSVVVAANSVDGNANWTDKAVYVSTGNTWVKDAQKLTIYVVDNMTNGWGTQDGSVIVVTEGVTLTLTSLSIGTKVILAKDANLILNVAPDWAQYNPSYVHSITFAGANSGLYMTDNNTVTATNIYFKDGAKVKNTNGTITASYLGVENGAILWNDGKKFEVTTLKLENEKPVLYNATGRTIKATDVITGNNECLIYNEGTITATGLVDIHNKDAEFVNAGTLEAGQFDMRAGGKFYNTSLSTTTIHGLTYLQNTSAQWVNKGEYNSGDFTTYNAGQLFNDCKLTVHADAAGTTGTFTMSGDTHNSFVVEANASVKTDYFMLSAEGDFFLKDYSLLWVVNKLTSGTFNPEKGFRGVGTTAYSVIKAGEIAYTSAFRWRMNYFGKIFVDTDKHFPQAFDTANNPADQPHYYFDSSVKLKFAPHNDACPLTSTIEAGDCHHGYTVTPPPVEATLRVMAEDLSATDKSDFDFNDVVFDVAVNANKTAAKIILRAAGGTLPLKINSLNGEGGWEVHDAFKVPRNTMVNTNAKAKGLTGVDNLAPVELGTITDDFSAPNIGNAVKNIRVEVYKNGSWMELEAKTGEACCKFACSPNNDWVKERNNIDDFYTFSEWVQGFETKLTKKGNW